MGEQSMETETLARLYLEQGHPERAAAILERLLEREPARLSLQEGLARARAAMAAHRGSDPKDGSMSQTKLQILRGLLSRLTGEPPEQEDPVETPAVSPLKPPASAPAQRRVEILRAMLQRLQPRKP